MQYEINSGSISVVFDTVDLNAVIGDAARIDVGEAINYIKTGAAEIEAVVEEKTAAFNLNAEQKTDVFNDNATDKTSDYNLNAADKLSVFNENASDKLNTYNQNASDKNDDFNSNAADKLNTFNENATDKTTDFDDNASAKTNAYNDNATAKLSDFDANATNKTNAFNQNATDKTSAFNLNATNKTTDFNSNATAKTNAFNGNATDKTDAFNLNAANKTTDFNDNYTAKKALIDAEVANAEASATAAAGSETAALNYANTAKQWAIGDPSEPTGNSAKYWADEAQTTVSTKANVDLSNLSATGEAKFVKSVTTGSSNGTIKVDGTDVAIYGLGSAAYTASTAYATATQGALADTALQPNDNISELVNDAGYITGITSTDVTTALGYTPYNSSNPSGYITSSALAPYALSADLALVATSGAYSDLSGTPILATVATSGSYNDLLNKPTIPAAQVNSDWNATTGVAQILNKPTIPTVNNPTITFTQGGTTKGTITLNQSSNQTIALDAGGGGGSSYTAGTAISFTDAGYQQNFSVIGSPTISSDYIASNFTVDDYLKLPIKFDVSTNTWEMQLKFTTGSSLPIVPILGPSNGIDCQIPLILINGSFLYLLLSSNGSSWNLANTPSSAPFVTTNTTYWVKLIYSGSDYKLYVSTDGSLWDLQIAINSSTPIYQPQTVEPGIGINKWSSNPSDWNAFNGTVDLKECYIKVDGVEIWSALSSSTTAINCTLTSGTGIDITSDVISVEGVKDQQNTSTAIKTWTGTKAQYDAIATKDNNTLYNITDDDTAVVYQAYTKSETDEHISIALNNVLSALYPIGSIYIGTQSTCPLENLISGSTWEKVPGDKALQTSSSNYAANTTIAAGLPNITGYSHGNCNIGNPNDNGGAIRTFKLSTAAYYGSNTSQWADSFDFDASRSNPIYGNSLTVQPPAYVVNVWRRTA